MTDFKDSVTKVILTKQCVVASSIDEMIRVYDVRRGKLFEIKIGSPINNFDLVDGSTYCAISCLDSVSRVVDLSDGAVVAEFQGSHTSSKYHSCIKFS